MMSVQSESKGRTLLGVACILCLLLAPETGIADGLRIGVINERTDRPDYALSQYGALHAYLGERLSAHGVTLEPLVVTEDVATMIERLRTGEVDAVIEGVIPTLRMARETGALEPALLAWRKGQRQYHSVFFVRRDAEIQDLADLAGHTIAFESPRSTSAFYVPLATLVEHGLEVAPRESVASPQDVGYAFAGSELNQSYWVQRGVTDAGAFNDGDWQRTPAAVQDELRIIAETRPLLRWLLSVHTSVPAAERRALLAELVSMHETENGRAALQSAERIRRFEHLTADDRDGLDYWRGVLARIPPPGS